MNWETPLRMGQGVCFLAGGLLGILSIWQSTVLNTLPPAKLGLFAFALGFLAAAGSSYSNQRRRRAGIFLSAAVAFVVILVRSDSLGVFGAMTLFIIGLLLLADVLTQATLPKLRSG